MARTGDLYPDKYMKAHHLEEMAEDPDQEQWTFTIKGTDITEYEDGKKQLLLRFRETHLELGLNKGNAQALTVAYGSDESDDWVGKKVVLRVEIVKNSFVPSGKGPAIRVSEKATKSANRKQAEAPVVLSPTKGRRTAEPMTQAEADAATAVEGDDIPF